jgi:hypothetical protein
MVSVNSDKYHPDDGATHQSNGQGMSTKDLNPFSYIFKKLYY